MKKQSFLLVAGALIVLASCQNNATDTGANQAQIDSAVNARVEELRMQMMMQNDSLINAEAQRRADSMIAAMNATGGTTSGSRPAPSRGTTRPNNPKTPNPGSVTTRPGADNGTTKPVTDRPGADNGGSKSVTDRPGADKH